MTSRVMLFAGQLSYSIYLLHPIALSFVRHFVAPTHPLRLYIAYFVAFACAYPAHYFVETPGIAMGNLVAKRFEGWMREGSLLGG
jgi:peptidoglycan/LPS O-acetylase OafA/YrhL